MKCPKLLNTNKRKCLHNSEIQNANRKFTLDTIIGTLLINSNKFLKQNKKQGSPVPNCQRSRVLGQPINYGFTT